MGRVAQAGAKGAQDSLSRFVEGPDGRTRQSQQMDDSRRSFWDDFSSVADQRHGTGPKYSSIGTSAMGANKSANAPAVPPPGPGTAAPAKKKDDEWDDW